MVLQNTVLKKKEEIDTHLEHLLKPAVAIKNILETPSVECSASSYIVCPEYAYTDGYVLKKHWSEIPPGFTAQTLIKNQDIQEREQQLAKELLNDCVREYAQHVQSYAPTNGKKYKAAFLIVEDGARKFGKSIYSKVTALIEKDENRTAAENLEFHLDSIRAKSYDNNECSEGIIKIIKEPELSLSEYDLVLIVEDIADSRGTIKGIKEYTKEMHGCKNIKSMVLLDKHERCKFPEVELDYIGFKIQNLFVVGYGLDCTKKIEENEKRRIEYCRDRKDIEVLISETNPVKEKIFSNLKV